MKAPTILPIIDVAAAFAGGIEAGRAAADEIHAACIDHGFFYIIGHGVPQYVIDQAFSSARAFFALSENEKQRAACNDAYRGFTGCGINIEPDGRRRVGRREYFLIGHEIDDPDAIGKGLGSPNNWPTFMPEFRRDIYAYYEAVSACGARLLRLLALSLGIVENFFDYKYGRPGTLLTPIHYPPIPADAAEDADSIPVHTDFGCITLLSQDDAGGLKATHRTTRELIDVPPIECSFVINVGDMLARWSNDRFVSTPHGVVNRSGKERYSLALFYNPQADAVVDPRQLGVRQGSCKYPPITAGAYLRQARAANAHRLRYG
jgi:isopenicillin N synthase-like dioxygenase